MTAFTARLGRAALLALLLSVDAAWLARAHAQAGGSTAVQEGPKLTKPPELLQFVEAEYPESERASGKAASVVLQITISPAGSVDDAVVAESAGPAFDAAAVAAAKRFVFSPAEIDGKPAPIRILYRYEFVLRVEAPTTAVFAGTVRTRNAGVPLSGVSVELDTQQSALTDAQGKFEIADVAPGKHAVTLSGAQLTALRTEETFEAGQRLEATYDVQPDEPDDDGGESDDLELVVVAPPLRKQVVSTAVSAQEAAKVPGTQGDVLRVVENLPGVARSALGSGQLVVWGSAPEDTRVYVDGVHIPRLYHNGGLRSVINSDFVDAVDLVPGGYGAAFGRGLGGLVTVTTRNIEPDRAHGSLALDLLDASGSVRAPVSDHVQVAVAARRSHLNDFLSGAIDDDVEDYFPIPRYLDAQARVRYTPDDHTSVSITGLLSADRIERGAVDPDPARTVRETRTVDFQRVYLSYRTQLGDGGALTLTPFIGFDQSQLENRVGNVPTDLGNDASIYGLRTSYRARAAAWATLEVGLDAEISHSSLSRSGSIGAPAREGDVRVFGQPPPDQINADDWNVTLVGVAPYVEGDLSFFDAHTHVYPGLRFDPNLSVVNRRAPIDAGQPPTGISQEDFAVEPRLAVRQDLGSKVAVKAAWGVYHQPPLPEELSATFGNPALLTSSAMHWVLGGTWQVLDTLSVELTGFYETSQDLAVRSPLSSPLSAEALVPTGDGRAYGTQILVRKELSSRFFGWLSYSLVRSERRSDADAAWRPFDFDQTHILTALASYDLGAGFEIGARLRYSTGFPRTEVIDAFYDARRDVFQPLFGRQNGVRIPAFLQLDARVAKRFLIGETQLDAYLEVQNATDRDNPEEIVYAADYKSLRYITSLPILPVAGVRWSF
jgi:TonB family protein